jgi:flagellar basal-body rod modification protein FlgD
MTIDAASGSSAYDSLITNSNAMQASVQTALGSSSSASSSAAKTAADKDTFLKLLVAQLRYQDPSSPVDSSQFIAQTAQFSSLETLQDMSTSNSSMLAAQLKLQAGSMVGKTVTYAGATGSVSGVVTSASFNATSMGGTNGEPLLTVDGKQVVLSKVTGIVDSGSATTTPTATA